MTHGNGVRNADRAKGDSGDIYKHNGASGHGRDSTFHRIRFLSSILDSADLGWFTAQLHWLLTRTAGGVDHSGRHWVYRTYEEWQDDMQWSSLQRIRKRIIGPLRDRGVLLTIRRMRGGQDYSIDYVRLSELANERRGFVPDWLMDAAYDPDLGEGVQGAFPDDRPSQVVTFDHSDTERRRVVTSDQIQVVGSDQMQVVTSDHLYNKELQQRIATEDKLASSSEPEVSETGDLWERVVGVGEKAETFMDEVWVLYCDNFDAYETVEIDDGKWQPLRQKIIKWQRGHRALIDPSQAQRLFDSITTENPREPIGLIFTVFRDALAARNDLDAPYAPQVRQGSIQMAGRY